MDNFFKPFNVSDSPVFLKMAAISARSFLEQSSLPFSIYYYNDSPLPSIPELDLIQSKFASRLQIIQRPAVESPLSSEILFRWSPIIFERFSIMNELGVGALYLDADIILWRRITTPVLDRLEKKIQSEDKALFAFIDGKLDGWMPDLGDFTPLAKEYYHSGLLIKGSRAIENQKLIQIPVRFHQKYGFPLRFPDQDAINIQNIRERMIGRLEMDDLLMWTMSHAVYGLGSEDLKKSPPV